ncbi:MAG: SDR family NAD(P)-dependent oxidoreductase [Schleiferiaceae bacterium]
MKTVWITGASSGFGAACVHWFAARGWRVGAWARRGERLNALKAEVIAAHPGAELWTDVVDVRDAEAVVAAWDRRPFADVDVLVNNAGLARGRESVEEGSLQDWNEMIDTNLKGLLHVTRAVAPAMVARGKGHIINVGSLAGREAYPGGNVYGATKFAVDGLTDGMRLDLTPKGIKVSQIAPGMANTEFSNVRFHGDQGKAEAVYSGLQPLFAQDVADVIGYMASAPDHINLADVLLMPAAQASSTLVRRT